METMGLIYSNQPLLISQPTYIVNKGDVRVTDTCDGDFVLLPLVYYNNIIALRNYRVSCRLLILNRNDNITLTTKMTNI